MICMSRSFVTGSTGCRLMEIDAVQLVLQILHGRVHLRLTNGPRCACP